MQKISFETIDSTNTYAKTLLASGNFAHGTVITAKRQTGGRGRMNRAFFSEGGLYMSVLLDNRTPSFPITCAAAVAVCQVIEEETGISLSVKWVNDLLYAQKKVCGILTEAVTQNNQIGGFVCGIGLNTQNTILPQDLQKIATVLPCSADGLAEKIAERLLFFYENNVNTMPVYKNALLLNCAVTVHKNGVPLFSGIAKDIDENGHLIVAENQTLHTLSSGEISICLGGLA